MSASPETSQPEDPQLPDTQAPETSPVGIPAIGMTAAPTPTPQAEAPQLSEALLVDAAPHRLRRTEDLLDLSIALAIALATLVLATYAHETTTGVTNDVQNVLAVVLRQILVFPLQAVEGLVAFIVPIALLLERVLRGSWRGAGEAALGGVVGWIAGMAVYLAMSTWAPDAMISGFTTSGSGTAQLGISTTFAALAGMLTAAGERRSTLAIRWGWGAVWVIVGLAVLRSALPLTGAVLSVSIGRSGGLLVRYAMGVEDRRGQGVTLLRALRRAGLDAERVVRMDSLPASGSIQAWTVSTDAPLGYTERVRETPVAAELGEVTSANHSDTDATAATDGSASGINAPDKRGIRASLGRKLSSPYDSMRETEVDIDAILTEARSSALTDDRDSAHRLYAVWDRQGVRRDVTVLDADNQVVGFLQSMWDNLRVRGLSPNRDISVRAAAEHAALMTLEAGRAGVRTPHLYGLAEANESVLLVTDHIAGARRLSEILKEEENDADAAELTSCESGAASPADQATAASPASHTSPASELTGGLAGEPGAEPSSVPTTTSATTQDTAVDDALLQDLWTQVRRAHAAGLAHREISAQSVVVDANRKVWLLDWDSGETLSSEISRRVDLAQALALLATLVGTERAIATASQTLSTQQLASIGPMLQRVVLPASTREAMGRHGTLLQELRNALVDLTPAAHAEPAKLTRFSWHTVVMAVVGLAALWTLLARLNLEQITEAVRQANPWWIAAALVFSLATYLGAGLSLAAFSPVHLSIWRSTEVHLASSVVSLVAPAGVGGAAINLRFLSRKGVPTAIGVATVALVQVVQFLVTVVLLVILAATTGQSTGLTLPSGWIIAVAIGLVGIVAVALFIPRVRTWVWAKIEPTYRQVWPRLLWVLSNPMRLAVGVGGNILLSLSYILSFAASLWAFGHTIPFSVLAITYLASNTVGSVVPSPGGIGPVEIALTAGLVAAGVPSGVALSAAIVYRLVTFWIPIPVGYLSLQRLQRTGDL